MRFASRVAAQDDQSVYGLHPCLTIFTSVIIIIPPSEIKEARMNAKEWQGKLNEWKLNANGEKQVKF